MHHQHCFPQGCSFCTSFLFKLLSDKRYWRSNPSHTVPLNKFSGKHENTCSIIQILHLMNDNFPKRPIPIRYTKEIYLQKGIYLHTKIIGKVILDMSDSQDIE